VRAPAAVGSKLIDNWQEAPAANAPAVDEVVLTSGQAVPPLLLSVKLVAMLGLSPAKGTGRLSAALPILESVIVCGLSLLVEPMFVELKVREGEST
jgi:hypothetical protein